MTSRYEVRIGDAEREAAVSALAEHYAAGRLTKEEYDERAEQAWVARTAAALAPLFADLPAPHAAGPTGPTPATGRTSGKAASPARRARIPFLPVLLLVVGLAMLVHVPWPFLLLAGWLLWRVFFYRGYAGRWQSARWAAQSGRWGQAGCGRGYSSRW
jgi:hypothetical protein